MNGPALVIMARAPVAGRAKTRLQPALSPGQSAALAMAFLKDAIDLAGEQTLMTPFLAYTPASQTALFQELTRGKIQIIPQAPGDLGKRMFKAMSSLSVRGFSPVVVIGTDIPVLQPATLLRSVEILKTHALCLGPSSDGGYYLIGMNQADERVFQNVHWGTPAVLEETIENASIASLTFSLLEKYSDIDTFSDLEQLNSKIDYLTRTPDTRLPRHTCRWLHENQNFFGRR